MAARSLLLTLALLLVAVPAWADDDHDHADAIIWDGNATEDCSVADAGTIRWEFTDADDVTYAELHIDEPEASVQPKEGPPYVWTSELYPLDQIEADVDHIHGEPGPDAQVLASFCPRAALADTGVSTPVLVLLAAGFLGAGALAMRRTA